MVDSSVPGLLPVDHPEGCFLPVPVGHQAADPSVDHFVPDPDRVVLQEADPSADRQTAAQVEDSPVPDLIPVVHQVVGYLPDWADHLPIGQKVDHFVPGFAPAVRWETDFLPDLLDRWTADSMVVRSVPGFAPVVRRKVCFLPDRVVRLMVDRKV